MQQVAEILNHLIDAPKSISSNPQQQGHLSLVHQHLEKPKRLSDELIQYVFTRFAGIYHHAWTSAIKEERRWQTAMIDWSFELGEFTKEQIDIAIAKCRRQYLLPPTCGQFSALCREIAQSSPNENDSAAQEIERREKLEDIKTKQLTYVSLATQRGWAYKHLTPLQTQAAYVFGDLKYDDIKQDIDCFLEKKMGSLAPFI